MIGEDTDRVEVEVNQREKDRIKSRVQDGCCWGRSEKGEHHLAQQPLTLNNPPISLLYLLLLPRREDSSDNTTHAKLVQQPPASHHGPVTQLCPFC